MSAVDAQHWVRDVMEQDLSSRRLLRSHQRRLHSRRQPEPPPSLETIPALLGVANDAASEPASPRANTSQAPPRPSTSTSVATASAARVFCFLGEVLAEAGLDAGVEVFLASVLRPRDALRHVKLPRAPLQSTIDSPLVTAPNVLLAMNEPSLRKFDKTVRSGGWVIYNGDTFPPDCARRRPRPGSSIYANRPRTRRHTRHQYGHARRPSRDR